MKPKIFVLGWFDQGNLGDQAFQQAYLDLWGSRAEFTFSSKVPKDINEKFNACFIGGGSFLDQEIPEAAKIKIPFGLIGVGIHDSIHESNWPLIKGARIIVARNHVSHFPIEAIVASDMVFGRKTYPKTEAKHCDILILGNDFLVPRKNDPHWKHVAFQWFNTDFPSLLDEWIELGRGIEFYPMGTGRDASMIGLHDDRTFTTHVVAQMNYRNKVYIHSGIAKESELIQRIRNASLIISFRFHGNVFATIFGKRFIGIVSHDKMKSYFDDFQFGNFIDYYGFTKNIFNKKLKDQINPEVLLEKAQREHQRWLYISDIVAGRFGM